MFHPRPSSALGQFYSKRGEAPLEADGFTAPDENEKENEISKDEKSPSAGATIAKLEPAKGYLELAAKNIYDKHYLIQLIFTLQRGSGSAAQGVLKFRFVDFVLPKESARPFFEQESYCQKKGQDDVTSHKRGFNFRVPPVRGLCMQNPTNVGQGKGGGFGNLRIPFDAGVSDGLKRMDFINAGTRSEDPLWHRSLPETGSLDLGAGLVGVGLGGTFGASGGAFGVHDLGRVQGGALDSHTAGSCAQVNTSTGTSVGNFATGSAAAGAGSAGTTSTSTAARKYTEAIKGLKKNFGLRKGADGMLFPDGGSYDAVADKHSVNAPRSSNPSGAWSFPSERLQQVSNGTRQGVSSSVDAHSGLAGGFRAQDCATGFRGGALDSFPGSGLSFNAPGVEGHALNAPDAFGTTGGKGGNQSYLERLFDKSFEKSARQQEFGEGVASMWSENQPQAQAQSQSQSSFNGNWCDLNWQYMDPQGQVHGPFDSRQMHKWYLKNFFPPNLAMRYSAHEPWRCFKDYYPPGTVPFKDYPRGAVKGNGKVQQVGKGAPADLVQDIVQMPSIQDIISSPRGDAGVAGVASASGVDAGDLRGGVPGAVTGSALHETSRVHESVRSQDLPFTGSGRSLDSLKGSAPPFTGLGVEGATLGGTLASGAADTSGNRNKTDLPPASSTTPLSRFKDESKSPSASTTPKKRHQFQGKPRQPSTIPGSSSSSSSFVAASARLASLTIQALDSSTSVTATCVQAETTSSLTPTTLKQQPHVWNRPGDIVVDSLVDIMKAQSSTAAAAAAAASASQSLHAGTGSASMESKPKQHVKMGWNFETSDTQTTPTTMVSGGGRSSGNVMGADNNNNSNNNNSSNANGGDKANQDGGVVDDNDEDFPTLSTQTTTTTTRRSRHPNTETTTTKTTSGASGNNTSHGHYSSYSGPSIGKMPLKLFMEQTKGSAPLVHSRVDASETFAAKLMASNNRQHDHI